MLIWFALDLLRKSLLRLLTDLHEALDCCAQGHPENETEDEGYAPRPVTPYAIDVANNPDFVAWEIQVASHE